MGKLKNKIILYAEIDWFIMEERVNFSLEDEKGERNEHISSELWKLLPEISGNQF